MPRPVLSADQLDKCAGISFNEDILCSIKNHFSLKTADESIVNMHRYSPSSDEYLQQELNKSTCDNALIDANYHNENIYVFFQYSNNLITSILDNTISEEVTTSVCFRSGPSQNYRVIHKMSHFPHGIKLLKITDDWLLIANMQNKQIGWIKDTYSLRSKINNNNHFNQKSHANIHALSINKSIKFRKKIHNQKLQRNIKSSKANAKYSTVNTNDIVPLTTPNNDNRNKNYINETGLDGVVPRPFFSNQFKYKSNEVNNVFNADGSIPYFAKYTTDVSTNFPGYIVFEDSSLFSNPSILNIRDQIISDRITSVSSVNNSEVDAVVLNKIYFIESGEANFEKFILHDDGHMLVDYRRDYWSNTFDIKDFTNNSNDQLNTNSQAWIYMPLIYISRSNMDRTSSAASVRVRHIYRPSEYSDCNHIIVDSFQEHKIKYSTSFIVGDAELCFNTTGKRAKLSYGYELWQPLTSNNRSLCLSIDASGRLCRLSDSRLRPLVSYWSSND